ncbi:polysialyltransferase family glycosyltransferase [Isoptericola aurantiacus]|uniref:polysialyltransferase family glycosyltransferase n=1 Tax=Isoptericola aurantiacus TaxID=3377839 RepID=UPI00383AB412
MTVQIITASTLFGAATVVAAWDAGVLERRERTLLVVQNNVPVPEAHPPFTDGAAFAALRERFDDVVAWNDVVAPLHPQQWRPRAEDVPLWQRLLRDRWGLGDEPVEVVGESVATPPTGAIVSIFSGAAVTVYADGLMVYGPTRFGLPFETGGRIDRLLHLDLLPGVRPSLLAEWDVPSSVISTEAFRKVIAGLTTAPGVAPIAGLLPERRPYALILGQYLAAIGLVSVDEEAALHRSMVRAAADQGFTEIVLKPHPSAPRQGTEELAEHARTLGVTLTAMPSAVLAEQVFAESPPGLVLSCFSTALATASAVYGIPTSGVGTAMLLERLEPYSNSNRVPAVVTDALGRPDDTWRDPARLEQLVRAVSYCQQPQRLTEFRASTTQLLRTLDVEDVRLWFRRGRLTTLGLPGGFRLSPWRSTRLFKLADALDRRTGGALRKVARRHYSRAGEERRAGMAALEARND